MATFSFESFDRRKNHPVSIEVLDATRLFWTFQKQPTRIVENTTPGATIIAGVEMPENEPHGDQPDFSDEEQASLDEAFLEVMKKKQEANE